MIFDSIEWDELNLDHATTRVSAADIEQAIWNADRMFVTAHTQIECCSGPKPTAVGVWSWWRRSFETAFGQ